ncbi:MAG: FAD:protein FMN transferase, partial [Clostridia bacterium]|nr:FAD:protein FMN transferase [Clostridia bacterium]
MKKIISLNLSFVLLLLCGCAGTQENKDTRFMLDTVFSLTAACDSETLDGAFALCESYENLFSRTVKNSEVYTLNNSNGFIEVSDATLEIIQKAIYYSNASNGKFDITIYPVSSL